MNATIWAYYPPSSNSSKISKRTALAIALGIIVPVAFIQLACCYANIRRKRQQRGRPTGTRQRRSGNTHYNSTPARRAMANYTTSVERPGNVLVEAFGAETSSDNTPDATPQIHQSRTPPQNSTGSLPEYHEQAPVGEVVLLEPVRHGSMADSDDDDRNRDETGGTLSIGVVLPYTDSGQTSEPPRTIISSRSGTSSLGSLQDRSANLGFDATTTASSMGVTGPEYARTTEAGILEVITNTTASSYGDVPTYEESTAVALSHTIDITEAMDGPTRVDQG